MCGWHSHQESCTAALARKLGLVIPQLRTAVGMLLSNNPNSARKVGDAFGHPYTTVTGAHGNQVLTLHETVLAYLFDELNAAGLSFQGGESTFAHWIFQNPIHHDNRYLQGILLDLVLDCLLPPGQPSSSLDGYQHLGELKTLSQRSVTVEERAERIQRDLEQNAKDLGARDPRNTAHAQMIEGR